MARDGSGNYTLPAGNPVVTATTVTTAWANNTLNDLATAMTGSLARNGSGGMSAALRGIDGVVGAPAFSFTSETSTGLFRNAAADVRLSLAGTEIMRWTAGVATVTGVVSAALGAPTAPAYTFNGDPNTGIYSSGADAIDFAVGGFFGAGLSASAVLTVLNGYRLTSGNIQTPLGAVGTASYTFTGDTNTGMYSSLADVLDFAAGGVNRLSLNATRALFSTQIQSPVGSVGSPTYAFTGDADCGLYSTGTNGVGLAAGGVAVLTGSTSSVTLGTNNAQYDSGSGAALLAVIETETFSGTLTGCTTSPSQTFTATKVRGASGSSAPTLITLTLATALTATSNSTAMTVTGAPSTIIPNTPGSEVPCVVTNNGSLSVGSLSFSSGGTMTFNLISGTTYSPSGFTNTGTKGLPAGFTVTYAERTA